jgi:acetylornithine/N-succinyldiaminopimelate aminotransferase
MSNDQIRQEHEQFVMNTYGRQPIAFVKGQGLTLTDADGREYQDFLAGLAVSSLGHCHPSVVEAVRKQVGELIHTSNLYLVANQSKLARYLVDLAFAGKGKAFFCNSGAEANEAAVKLARRWQEKVAGKPERKTVLTFENSFHGRTLAMLSATGQKKYRDGFEPLPAGFRQTTSPRSRRCSTRTPRSAR